MNVLQEVWNFFLDLWDTGNFWARIAIVVLLGWPVAILLTAAIGIQALTAIVALLPFFVIFLLLFAIIDPLVWAVVAQFKQGRIGLKWLGAIIGIELTLGVLFSTVPVGNDRKLLPLLALTTLALIFIQFWPSAKWKRVVGVILGGIILVIAIIMFRGGREKIEAEAKKSEVEKAQQTAAETPGTTACPGGTIEIAQAMVIPMDTCVSWVEVAWAPHLKTIDAGQSLGLVWPSGERVLIEGNQRFDLPPQHRKFGVWSDRRGLLQITPKESLAPDGIQASSEGTVPEKTSLPGPITYVQGVVKENDSDTDTLVILADGKYQPFHTPGYIYKKPGWPGFFNTHGLEPGDEVQLRLKDGEVQRVTLIKDIREVLNGYKSIL